jgi:predicted DNA-binding transcriptional regulator AlpA
MLARSQVLLHLVDGQHSRYTTCFVVDTIGQIVTTVVQSPITSYLPNRTLLVFTHRNKKMALQIPAKLPIQLPKFRTAEVAKLFKWVEDHLPDSEFRTWLLLHIGSEILRRAGHDIEPQMAVIRLRNGVEHSKALEAVTAMAAIKGSRQVRLFIEHITAYVHAMVAATLEVFSEQIEAGLPPRGGINNTSQVLLMPSEASAMLGISDGTLRKMVDDGSFPKPLRIGSKRYWTESSVQNFINRQADNSANEE